MIFKKFDESECVSDGALRRRRSIKGQVMEVAEIFVSARPSYFIDESDNFIPRVDEGPIPIFVEKNIFGDFVAIILLSSLAAMIVLLLLLLRKMYVHRQVKTI